MPKATTAPPCPHGIDRDTCPACVQEQYDEHRAVQLAARDPETVDQWRRDLDAWIAGDPVPSHTPEVP